MTTYVRVSKAPLSLDKHCYVIEAPNFKDEVEQCANRLPKSGFMSANLLREVIGLAGRKYISHDFDVLREVNVSHHVGTPFDGIDGAHRVVMTCVRSMYPALLDAFVDYYIRKRPFGTKLIYFLGAFSETASFAKNGIEEIKEKHISKVLGSRTKKITNRS